ncbi:MAG: hypothetical protein IID38_12450, partial [Planctomycetes bacterium]|nr:hypothetical protein [Planctomycetota bacterium]
MLTKTSESRVASTPVIEPSQADNVALRTAVSGSPAPDAQNDRPPQRVGRLAALAGSVSRWFDKGSTEYSKEEISEQYAVDPIRMIPYAALHLMCLGVFWVGWSPVAVAVAGVLYVLHMFSITAF